MICLYLVRAIHRMVEQYPKEQHFQYHIILYKKKETIEKYLHTLLQYRTVNV
jgi:hypothetical protein